MKLLILLLFIAVPLAEIALLIKIGEVIGVVPTVGLVVLTAVIGVALLKRQGLAAMAEAQRALDAGELPVDSVIDGVCLLVAGAFLLTPGLITDTAGFLLLVPALRRRLGRWALARLAGSGVVAVHVAGGARRPGPHGPGPVIEGEFEEVEERRPPAPPATPRPGRDEGTGSPWKK